MAVQQKISPPLLVLCYHGISHDDEHDWNPELYMPRHLLEQRLRSLQTAGFEIRALAPALYDLRSGNLKAPAVALTFDDGWHDFYSDAWPILQKFDAPATVYQTTFYSNYNKPVFDVACSYLLWRGRGRTVCDRLITGQDPPLVLATPEIIRKVDVGIKARVRQMGYDAEDKDAVLRRMAESLGLDYAKVFAGRRLHLMNAAEIAEISRGGVDVQLHTHHHALPKEKDRFLHEVERNRFFIEIATGQPAVHFCYPNGWHRPELGAWLAEAGVSTATTCDPGFVRRGHSSFYLPRLTDSFCVSQVRFESWLSGIGLIGASCKRRLGINTLSPGLSPQAIRALEDSSTLEPSVAVPSQPEPLSARAASGRN